MIKAIKENLKEELSTDQEKKNKTLLSLPHKSLHNIYFKAVVKQEQKEKMVSHTCITNRLPLQNQRTLI